MALLGDRQHDGSACFWVSENQQLRGTHFHSHLFRFSAVVHQGEQGNAFCLENALELLDRFVHGVIAGYIDDTSPFTERHSYLFQ